MRMFFTVFLGLLLASQGATAGNIPVVESLADGLPEEALKTGFFYLKKPDGLDEDTQKVRAELPGLFKNEALKEIERGAFGGHTDHNTQKDGKRMMQVETIAFTHEYWAETYGVHAPEIMPALEKQTKLATTLLRETLKQTGIPEEQWDQISNGASEGKGVFTYLVNHYQSNVDARFALKEHCDFSMITILDLNKKGLEAWIAEAWVPVDPKPGYFVINYGQALEHLTNGLVKAILHRVKAQTASDGDRFTGAFYIDGDMTKPLMQYQGHDKPCRVLYKNYEEFITKVCYPHMKSTDESWADRQRPDGDAEAAAAKA